MSEHGVQTRQWRALPAHLQASELQLGRLRPRLTVTRPGLPEVHIAITKTRFVIGRATEGVDLRLEDETVSREHAALEITPKGYVLLTDLGSRNGIRYAERQVRRLNLHDGDHFEIGEAHFCFQAELSRFDGPSDADDELSDVLIEVPEVGP